MSRAISFKSPSRLMTRPGPTNRMVPNLLFGLLTIVAKALIRDESGISKLEDLTDRCFEESRTSASTERTSSLAEEADITIFAIVRGSKL